MNFDWKHKAMFLAGAGSALCEYMAHHQGDPGFPFHVSAAALGAMALVFGYISRSGLGPPPAGGAGGAAGAGPATLALAGILLVLGCSPGALERKGPAFATLTEDEITCVESNSALPPEALAIKCGIKSLPDLLNVLLAQKVGARLAADAGADR
jgi:hypothetical protein